MKKTLLVLLLAVPAAAQTANKIAEPTSTMTEQDKAKEAIKALKAYTDQFRVPSGDPFPEPPAIKHWTAKEVDANTFSQRADFNDWKRCISDYRTMFDWWEGLESGEDYEDQACFKKRVHLDPERFQVAYGLASSHGTDLKAGGRWVCGLADALRGYFNFYNESAQGSKGQWMSHDLWGVGVGPVVQQQTLNDWISARYKEASGVDLGQGENRNFLNYATVERCAEKVEEATKEQIKEKPAPKKIPSLMHTPEKEQVFIDKEGKDIDFGKGVYWVYFYDASWQPWAYIAKTTRWKNTEESLRDFVRCRAPFFVGNFLSLAPFDAKPGKSPYFPPPSSTTLRHPDQPNSAKERDPKKIAEARKKFCK